MGYVVLLTPKAVRQLSGLDKAEKERMKEKLKALKERPQDGEQLTGTKYHRIRVGDYRAIYQIDEQEKRIIVLYIGHRSKVYDDFKKLM